MRPESRAVLELLLQRGQSYGDIADVLGTDADDVRRRTVEALGELTGTEPDSELADYVVGQAGPVERADAVRRLQTDRDAHSLVERLISELRELAPAARYPTLPGGEEPPSRPRAARAAEPSEGGLSQGQRRVMIALGAAALVVLAIVLVATGVLGEDESEGPATEPAASDGDAVRVELEPQAQPDASGEGVFGLATADQLFLDLEVRGLEVPSPDETYVVWLLLSPDEGYPVSPFEVDDQGSFADRFPIPRFAATIAGRARFLDVGLANRSRLEARINEFAEELGRSQEAQLPIFGYEGESALRGEIPATGGPAATEPGAAPDG